jgi:hypothetical protein
MQTAFLILAHHQPKHLARLIRMLDGPTCTFLVHIDAKVDETVFQESVGEKSNVIFIETRHGVNWGGFSIVEATLALLTAALGLAPFGRFCLLSGSDFPIQCNSQILAEFDSSREFMRVDRKLNSSQENSHSRCVAFHWFMDSWDAYVRDLSGKLKRQPYEHVGLYQGSQWWALTRDCIEYIVHFVSSNPEYSSFCKSTLCPDEIFFHSIVKQSPFAPRITHDFETASSQEEYALSNEHGCHYIDWNARGDALPKVLDLEDLDKLLSSKCLFARKFDEQRSGALVARLEEMPAGTERTTSREAFPT